MIRFLAPDSRQAPDPTTLGADIPAILAGKLGPALYHHLTEAGRLSDLSLSDQRSLREVYTRNALQNLVLENGLRLILAAFDRERIPVMPIKGAVSLIDSLYPSTALRVMTDLDLLVPVNWRTSAITCLESLEYRPREERGTVLPEMEYPMVRDGILVDLHWQLTRIKTFAGAERVWKRAKPVTGFSDTVVLPSNLDQFYIRFLHDTIQDHHLHAVRLWQAYEAALIFRRLEADGDAEGLCAQALDDGLSSVLGVYLAQTHSLFPCITRWPPELRTLYSRGMAELRACDSLGRWPQWLHFAVGRGLLLRLRAPALRGYRRAFVQIMWRECTLEEPTDVVRRGGLPRVRHLLRISALHVAQALWRQYRRALGRLVRRNTSREGTWLHVHRNQSALGCKAAGSPAPPPARGVQGP